MPMKAFRFPRHGGPDVLVYEDVDIGQPGPGQVRVRNRAIGVNFVDIYLRTGDDASASLPFTLGKEGAGEILAVGKGVAGFAPGDRVPYVETPGPYAQTCISHVHSLLPLPH